MLVEVVCVLLVPEPEASGPRRQESGLNVPDLKAPVLG